MIITTYVFNHLCDVYTFVIYIYIYIYMHTHNTYSHHITTNVIYFELYNRYISIWAI